MNLKTRRRFLGEAGAVTCSLALANHGFAAMVAPPAPAPLQEFGYEQVNVRGLKQTAQRENVSAILMGFSADSLLKPLREMSGQTAPGTDLGGWYEWKPDYDHHHDDAGLAPGHSLGQWTSALSRLYAGSRFGAALGREDMAARVAAVHAALPACAGARYFAQTRFPGYTFDKLVCGLTDARRLAGDTAAFATIERITEAAEPSLPGFAVDREVQWKPGTNVSWMWDETYTMPENLYLAAAQGAGPKYRKMAQEYLLNRTYFEPLSRGVNALADRHAYSYVNALCSAMQAYLADGSTMHLAAAKHGFDFLQAQSFATGGWGPDELLRKPGYDEPAKSLAVSHNSFETPCGSYAHMKLTRYLLRATREGRYGDSMERVLHNTVLGALPLQADGRSFYSSDYSVESRRVYSVHRWPCCSGTLPQVVADYGINSYLHEPGSVWVNLYHPSELRWTEAGSDVTLEQTGGYPQDGSVSLRLGATKPVSFALRLRVPGWAGAETQLQVNGRPEPIHIEQGFTTVTRLWSAGDRVDLRLPMSLRLEELPADGLTPHSDTVALLYGPLVLFPLRVEEDEGPLMFTPQALLGAERTGVQEWRAESSEGSRRFVPFTEVGDREYSMYVKLA